MFFSFVTNYNTWVVIGVCYYPCNAIEIVFYNFFLFVYNSRLTKV